MIVKLRRRTQHQDLTFGQPYVVIGIEADEFRILNDAGRPFLCSPKLFSLADPREPDDWVTEFGDDGETSEASTETPTSGSSGTLRSGRLAAGRKQTEMVELSTLTKQHVTALSGSSDRGEAERLLASECAENLPLIHNPTPAGLERLRFAAIRVSGGSLAQVRDAIDLAKLDWRDLLVASDFANDVLAH